MFGLFMLFAINGIGSILACCRLFQGEVKVGGDAQEERLRRMKSDSQGFLLLV